MCYPPNLTIEPGLFQVSIRTVNEFQVKGIVECEGLYDWMLQIQSQNPDDIEWEFIYKYGADGSSSGADTQYQTEDAVDNPTGTIFTSTYVPLYLKAVSKSNPKNYTMVYAEQMAVSETRVIPLRMALEKETASTYNSISKHVHANYYSAASFKVPFQKDCHSSVYTNCNSKISTHLHLLSRLIQWCGLWTYLCMNFCFPMDVAISLSLCLSDPFFLSMIYQ